MFQKTGLRRNLIDKYYTASNTVDICVKHFKSNVEFTNKDLFIEPSAGNGSFIPSIKSMTNNHLFYDLEPENDEIIKQDYMQFKSFPFKQRFNKIHVLGNPPFGRRCSIAKKFIKKSAEFADTISFILPRSFKKEYYQKTVPLSFHLILQVDLPENSFLVNGDSHDVPCVFQIWEKRSICRTVPKLTPIGFEFVKKNDNPDISFRRKGWKDVGLIEKRLSEKESSSYYIRFTNGLSVDDNIKKLASIEYNHDNVITSRSISRCELIAKFNPLLS